MPPNPALRKLGFSDDERVAIIHCDDIGMCQASVAAFEDLWGFGLVSSGAVMVPCPWFPEAAALTRRTPGIDLGVHLTLTSEWQTYRWGPLSTRDPASGLLDAEGYFPRSAEETQAQATAEAVNAEMLAQVERAIQMGISPTHMDTHMGTVAHPKFIPGYLQMATGHRLPPMMLRLDEAGWRELGLDAGTAALAVQLVATLEAQGIPLLDRLGGLELDDPEDRMGQARRAFDALLPGITHFIIHPSKDTPELRAITPDWQCRAADYHTFMSEELRGYVKTSGVRVIGYRALQDIMPSAG